MSRPILLAAGGSGGHMAPALALYEALIKDYPAGFITDSKGRLFLQKVSPEVPSYLLRTQSPFLATKGVWLFAVSLWQGFRAIKEFNPRVIVGFGGYASVPPVVGGFLRRVPLIIHEQNRCLGRANRFLKPMANRLALGFAISEQSRKIRVTGNPTLCQNADYFPPCGEERIQVLISGGSQGARSFSTVVPSSIALLPQNLKQRLSLWHQTRAEDVQAVKGMYQSLGMQAEVRPFFTDLRIRLARSHLVISRSGAASLTEIMTVGRPALLIPYPFALDDHQRHNAEWLSQAGGARMLLEAEFNPLTTSHVLRSLLENPDRLNAMAKLSSSLIIPNAVSNLLSLIDELLSDFSIK